MLDLGQPMHAFDLSRLHRAAGRPAGRRRGDADHPGRRATHARPERHRHRRRHRRDLARRRHGRRVDRGRRTSTTDVLFEAAHWAPLSVAHTAPPAQAAVEASKRFERGVDPQLTAVAPARAVDAAGRVRRRHASTHGVTDVNTVVAAGAEIEHGRRPSRRGSPASTTRPSGSSSCSPSSAARSTVEDGDALTVVPADLAARSHRADRAGRGGHPAGRLRQGAQRAAVAPPGRGLTATQQRRRYGRAGAGRAPATSRSLCYPFLATATLDIARPAGRRRPRRDGRTPAQPAVGRGAAAAHDAAAAAARDAAPQPRPRPAGRRALRDSAWCSSRRRTRRRRRSPGSTTGRPTRVWRRSRRRCRASRGTSPRSWPATASRPAGGAPGRPADWADAVEAARIVAARRPGTTRPCGPGPQAPWHPGRCAEIWWSRATTVSRSSGTPASCIPAVCAALEMPEADLRHGAEPRRDSAARASSMAPRLSVVPAGTDRRGAGRGRRDPGRRRARPRSSTAPARCWSRCGCSTSTHGRAWAPGASRWRTSLTFRAPDRTLTGEEAVAARDAAVAVASAERSAPNCRGT